MKIRILIILLLFVTIGNAQNSPIKNLVFEGAGVRGIAYAGVLASLEEQGILSDIEKVGGTSAGAITALLFSLGYSPAELEQIISTTKFRKFNDGRFFFIGGISRMKNRYGWYRGEKFSDWLGKFLEEKTGNADITFEAFHQKGFKDLYCTATCLNKQDLIILSHETYPKMKVKDAVRISMSIPLYFQAVFVDSTGNTYKKQSKTNDLDIMVDGGIVGNFPIQIFDKIIINPDKTQTRIPNTNTIGVRMDSDNQITADAETKKLTEQKIEGFVDYISAFYIMVIENLNRNQLTEADWARTISVSSVGVPPKVKKLSPEQKASLIESGKKGTETFFNNQ